ncbi:hypothetical protein EDD85DRAFT_953204 [Armillaria nabsnona]|nr:hypothetical protein EDD85DRAFT_953204 [Armillaria nabsnona]
MHALIDLASGGPFPLPTKSATSSAYESSKPGSCAGVMVYDSNVMVISAHVAPHLSSVFRKDIGKITSSFTHFEYKLSGLTIQGNGHVNLCVHLLLEAFVFMELTIWPAVMAGVDAPMYKYIKRLIFTPQDHWRTKAEAKYYFEGRVLWSYLYSKIRERWLDTQVCMKRELAPFVNNRKVVDALPEPNKMIKVMSYLWRKEWHVTHLALPSFLLSLNLFFSSWNKTSYLVMALGLCP